MTVSEKFMLISDRLEQAYALASPCRLCPRECGADRRSGSRGVCDSPWGAVVGAAVPHLGEEPPLSGPGGSGTVFFSHCHLGCRHCQNYQISQEHVGQSVDIHGLEEIFLALQERGCHNVNLVTPTHFLPFILEGLAGALFHGFNLPIVYNSGGYESVETLALLEGIVDIYLPDMKYGNNQVSRYVSRLDNYVDCCRLALREMARQVGPLVLDERGLARRGLIVRHLVLPNDLADSRQALRIIVEETGPETAVALMGQYFPPDPVQHDPLLGRKITVDEWEQAMRYLDFFDIDSGWVQDPCDDVDHFIPDFRHHQVFSFMALRGVERCRIT